MQTSARSFVVRFVEAINSKSVERRRALLHPKSLPCASTASDSFYVWMVTRQFKDTDPGGLHLDAHAGVARPSR